MSGVARQSAFSAFWKLGPASICDIDLGTLARRKAARLPSPQPPFSGKRNISIGIYRVGEQSGSRETPNALRTISATAIHHTSARRA
jgi:hypothetical protein